MATDLKIPYVAAALTANGGANGIYTIADTSKFRKGARVLLGSSTQASVELVVDEVIDATHLALRDPAAIGTTRYAGGAYLTADTAKIVQNEQTDFYARLWTWV
jgi:hypothetical protein